MRLFTSSFKTTIIAPAVIMSLLMVLAYHLLIVGLDVKPGIADTPFKQNLLVVERYEFSEEPVECIALGSSILNRIVTQKCIEDTGCLNLCIKAFSALDGAAIIQHKGKYPRVAVIELSFMLPKKERYDFLAEVPAYKCWLSRYTPIVRTAYQPSSIMLRLLKQRKSGTTSSSTIALPKPIVSAVNNNDETTKVTTVANEKLPVTSTDNKAKSDPQRPGKMNERTKRAFLANLKRMQSDVLDLENHGVKVCFVRVPLSSTLFDSEREVEQTKFYESNFPQARYPWIEWSGPQREWQTFDGIHLKDDDAKIFAEDMRSQLVRIVRKTD